MNNNTPLVTVLMPCYNAMPYLREALESIIHQTYTNLEILCVNDGSTDDTGRVLEEYAQIDNRIKVIHNKTNIKLIRSLNKGIDLASGEYIARMDADDISSPERIESELSILLNNKNIDLVGTNINVINESGKKKRISILRQHSHLSCLFASLFYVPVHHATILARKEIFEKYKFREEEHVIHTEDYELFSRMLLYGVKMINLDSALYTVRINQNSVSRLYTQEQDDNFVECARRHYHAFCGKEINSEIMRVIVNRITKQTSIHQIRLGFAEMKNLKRIFIQKEAKRITPSDKKEINIVYKTHVFDICGQILKKTSLIKKLIALTVIAIYLPMIFRKKTRMYVFSKFFKNTKV